MLITDLRVLAQETRSEPSCRKRKHLRTIDADQLGLKLSQPRTRSRRDECSWNRVRSHSAISANNPGRIDGIEKTVSVADDDEAIAGVLL